MTKNDETAELCREHIITHTATVLAQQLLSDCRNVCLFDKWVTFNREPLGACTIGLDIGDISGLDDPARRTWLDATLSTALGDVGFRLEVDGREAELLAARVRGFLDGCEFMTHPRFDIITDGQLRVGDFLTGAACRPTRHIPGVIIDPLTRVRLREGVGRPELLYAEGWDHGPLFRRNDRTNRWEPIISDWKTIGLIQGYRLERLIADDA